jgi:outer membrane protein insertion porin family
MLNNCFKSIIQLVILLTSSFLFSQDGDTFERGKPYILAKIDVTGKLNFNEATVVTFTGLEKGQRIIVPGEEISTAIKKLAKLELFSDIDLYVTNVKGDSIFLELNINELPKLKEAKVRGVKKGKIEGILKDTDLKRGKVVNENLVTTTKNYLENKYKKDGFYNTKVAINVEPDSTESNLVKMYVNIDKGKKVKINKI